MFSVFSIAANGLATQARKVEDVALVVALNGTGAAARTPQGAAPSPVRIGSLPLGDTTEAMVSLKEAELAYRMNAAVIETASDMLDSLLDVLDPDRE